MKNDVLPSPGTDSAVLEQYAGLLDRAGISIYVIDKHTYELLYVNAPAMHACGDRSSQGMQCYRYFNGLDAPCPWCSLPLMRDGRAHVDENYVPPLDRWYRHDVHDVVWNGRDAAAFFITNITEDKRRRLLDEERFANLYRQIAAANPSALAMFRLNLTKNTCSDVQSSYDTARKQQDAGTVDGYLAACAEIITDDGIRRDCLTRFTLPNLLREFQNGVTEMSIEYPIRASAGDTMWINGIITMLKNPVSGDIEGIAYALNITDQKINSRILARITGEKYDHVGLISPAARSLELCRADGSYGLGPHRRVDYNAAFRDIAEHYILPEDRALFAEHGALDHIIARLEKNGSDTFVYRCPSPSGGTLYKQVNYTWLDEHRDLIIETQSDITALYGQQLEKARLEASRDNLDALLGNIPAGVAIFSERGRAIHLDYTNAGFYVLHHGSKAFWASRGDDPVFWLNEADRGIFESEFGKVKRGEKETGSATYRVLAEDGRLHWVNNQFRRAYVKNGIQYYYSSFADMDEQKDAEAARTEARKMYEAAVEDAKLVVWKYEIDSHRVIMAQNEFTEYDYRKFGLPQVIENAPQSLVPFIDDASAGAFLEMYRQVEAGAPHASCEVWYKLRAGQEPRYERITYTTIFDENGKPVLAYGIGQNLTAQKNQEERYRQAYLQLDRTHPASLASFHLNLTQNWCGEGKSSLDFVLKQQESGTVDGYFAEFSKLIADEDVKEAFFSRFRRQKLLEDFKNGHASASIQYPIEYRDGTRHWRDGQLYMLQNPVTGDVEAVTYAIDIDEQKTNELLTKRLTSDNFDYIGLIDPRTGMIGIRIGHTSTVIPQDQRTAYPYRKAVAAIAEQVAPEEREEYVSAASVEAILGGLRSAGRYSFSYRRSLDGRIQLRNVNCSWLEKPEGKILIVATDITAASEHEQSQLRRIKEALLEANRANESKSAFLSSMSHDLRTPLNGVLGFASVALRENDPDMKQRYLEKIKQSGDLLLDLVNDTLDLSRIESGKMALEPEPCNIRDLAGSVLLAVGPVAEQKGVGLCFDAGALPDETLSVDRLKLQKVILNLLSNAIKYTPRGGTVRFSVEDLRPPRNGMTHRFVVEDTGIGIGAEFQKHLFEPFSQERRPETANITGTGLGLSIVKRIVDLMGGTIRVQSAIGKGSRFTVTLPMKAAESAAFPAAEQAPAVSLRGRTILLCEDNSLNTEIALILLKEQGVSADCAVNGREGLEKFSGSSEGRYDAVLMDIRMPVMDGYEATRAIRALKRKDAKTVPIIAMTADAFEEDIRTGKDAGMSDYITKPVDPQKLSSVLRKNLADQ